MDKAENRGCFGLIQKVKGLKPVSLNVNKDSNSTAEMVQKVLTHYQCMVKVESSVKRCMPKGGDVCKKAQIQAVEVIRSNMEALEELILNVPDIYVIYYVRDPILIAKSVKNTGLRSSRGSKDLYA